MRIYFLLVRIAALFGHRKARLLVRGQAETLRRLRTSDDEDNKSLVGCLWVHAASVGEFEQARPLLERLRKEQPDRKIVITFFSPSGYEMRKNYEQADAVFYLPFATYKNARLFLNALKPSMALFVKYLKVIKFLLILIIYLKFRTIYFINIIFYSIEKW